jgi:hypothetical protein
MAATSAGMATVCIKPSDFLTHGDCVTGRLTLRIERTTMRLAVYTNRKTLAPSSRRRLKTFSFAPS